MTNPVKISLRYLSRDNNCTEAGYTFAGTANVSSSTLLLVPSSKGLYLSVNILRSSSTSDHNDTRAHNAPPAIIRTRSIFSTLSLNNFGIVSLISTVSKCRKTGSKEVHAAIRTQEPTSPLESTV